ARVCVQPRKLFVNNIFSACITEGYDNRSVSEKLGPWRVSIRQVSKGFHLHCSRWWWPSWLLGHETELHIESGCASNTTTAAYSVSTFGAWRTPLTGQ